MWGVVFIFLFKKKISVLICFYLFIAYVYVSESEFKCIAGVQVPREASRGHGFPWCWGDRQL